MIDDLEKSADSSLADKEIASLMKTLASNKYKENPAFPKKVIQPFKPLSLPEIASKATKESPSEESEIELESDESHEKALSEKLSDSDEVTSLSEKNTLATEQQHVPAEGDLSKVSVADSSENQSLASSTEPINPEISNSQKEQELVNQGEVNAAGLPVKEKLYTEIEKDAAYQKGLAEATEKFQSEKDVLKDTALRTLTSLISSLEEKITIDTSLLETEIKQEILKISTERVGAAIKDMPQDFTYKIKRLVNSIKEKGETRILKLNPNDLNEITPLLEVSNELATFVVNPDQNLAPGDIIIELGGITLEDRISDRYNSNEEKGKRNLELTGKGASFSNQKAEAVEPEITENIAPPREDNNDDSETENIAKTTQQEPVDKGDATSSTGPILENQDPLPPPDVEEEKHPSLGENIESENSPIEDIPPEEGDKRKDP